MLALVLVGDGRYGPLRETLKSVARMFPTHLVHRWVDIDDSSHDLGFAGAVAAGFEAVRESGADWVFWLEQDFRLLEPVPVNSMIALLRAQPQLAQVVLKRQPCNPREIAAGGIVEADPDDFVERSEHGFTWTEHRRFWSTNPSIFRATICERDWPQEPQSEGKFGLRLLADRPGASFAIWGGKFDPPRCEHVGHERIGVGY